MKLLELDTTYRRYLRTKGALTFDGDGNEALVGLTADESIEYLATMNTLDISEKIRAGADPERLLTLYDRHVAALPDVPSIFSSITPSDWRPRRK